MEQDRQSFFFNGDSIGSSGVLLNPSLNEQITWKLPLVTLLFQFVRPPLVFQLWTNTDAFILLHVVGNPISTIASLLVTLSACQKRVRAIRGRIAEVQQAVKEAKVQVNDNTSSDLEAVEVQPMVASKLEDVEELWKAFGIISVSYEEWGVKHIDSFLMKSL